MGPFLILVIILAAGLPPAMKFVFDQGWLPNLPSFLFATTWLVAFVTTVIFLYLSRARNSAFFVQLYMLSIAGKLLAYFAYCIVMIVKDRPGTVMNVLYFLALYFVFTVVEIVFLYRRISDRSSP